MSLQTQTDADGRVLVSNGKKRKLTNDMRKAIQEECLRLLEMKQDKAYEAVKWMENACNINYDNFDNNIDRLFTYQISWAIERRVGEDNFDEAEKLRRFFNDKSKYRVYSKAWGQGINRENSRGCYGV